MLGLLPNIFRRADMSSDKVKKNLKLKRDSLLRTAELRTSSSSSTNSSSLSSFTRNSSSSSDACSFARTTSGSSDACSFARTTSGSSSCSFTRTESSSFTRMGSFSLEEPEDEQAPAHRVPYRLTDLYDVIPGRLALTVHSCEEETKAEIKRMEEKVYLFSSDLQDRFEPFCAEFGPVKLSVVYTFCNYMREKMSNPLLKTKKLAYYCLDEPATIANTAFLLGCYAMIACDYSPEQASAAFSRISPCPIPEFRDATYRPADYAISLLDCFRGLKRAMALGWYSQDRFNFDEYEHWNTIENGDLHEVTPRFIAFRGPERKQDKALGTCSPQKYVPVFKQKGVSAVVRLNQKDTYNAKKFTDKGIRHYDLFFEDCGTPSPQLIKQFLDICDREPGRIAVHCMAGLGRTGTMIALWMMRKLSWKANEAIAWLRIVRPGCVIGDQQHFLKACEGANWERNTPLLSSVEQSMPEHAIQDALELGAALKARVESNNSAESTASWAGDSNTGSMRPAIANRRPSRRSLGDFSIRSESRSEIVVS